MLTELPQTEIIRKWQDTQLPMGLADRDSLGLLRTVKEVQTIREGGACRRLSFDTERR